MKGNIMILQIWFCDEEPSHSTVTSAVLRKLLGTAFVVCIKVGGQSSSRWYVELIHVRFARLEDLSHAHICMCKSGFVNGNVPIIIRGIGIATNQINWFD